MGNLCVCSNQQGSDNSDETPLLKEKRNSKSAALLIKKLISAVEDENENIVESLLDEFFNASHIFVKSWGLVSDREEEDYKFEIWRDAMYIAMEKDTKHSEEIMKLLLDCHTISSLETKMDDPLLNRLIWHGEKVDDKKLKLIEMLLKFGKINVNARDELGITTLHWVKEEQLVSLLIHYGADVNKRDRVGKTQLMRVCGDEVSVLQTILKEARTLVDLDAVDCNGQTALMIAASDARPDAVELLLNAGASVNLSDHLGFTALHHALHTRFDQYKVGRDKLAEDIHQKNISFYHCLGIHCERRREKKGTRVKTEVGRLWVVLKSTISVLSEQLLKVNKAVTNLDVELDKLLSVNTQQEHYSYTTLVNPHFCCEQ